MIENPGFIEPNTTHLLSVTEHDQELRVDKYLCQKLPLYSRSFFQQLIEDGRILINTTQLLKPSIRLKLHDQIAIHFPPKQVMAEGAVIESAHGVKLVFEHEHFLILFKPAGLIIHPPKTDFTSPTLTDWLKLTFKDLEAVGYSDRPGIVHRLDKDTSGLLIVARTNYAHVTFGALFKERKINKTYVALVHGTPPESGTIESSIGRHRYHRNKMTTVDTQDFTIASTVRDAVTHYKVLQQFDEYALVEAKPVTGRTHQIRVHLTSIGHPLIGDLLYGTKKTAFMPRHALHAHRLAFTFDGQEYTFTHELPDDFRTAITTLSS